VLIFQSAAQTRILLPLSGTSGPDTPSLFLADGKHDGVVVVGSVVVVVDVDVVSVVVIVVVVIVVVAVVVVCVRNLWRWNHLKNSTFYIRYV
jgi:hypothetical protein